MTYSNKPPITLRLEGNLPYNRLRGYAFFWAKYVTGFNSRIHCAESLLGMYSQRVGNDMLLNQTVWLNETSRYDTLYLCGVTYRNEWSKNLHLAVRYEQGATAEVTTMNGVRCVMQNARQIEIPMLANGFGGRHRDFTTCRNWQHGVAQYGLAGY